VVKKTNISISLTVFPFGVNTPRKWHKIADSLCIPKAAQGRITKLQDIYYKYVLPFDILSSEEKEKIKSDAAFSPEGKVWVSLFISSHCIQCSRNVW